MGHPERVDRGLTPPGGPGTLLGKEASALVLKDEEKLGLERKGGDFPIGQTQQQCEEVLRTACFRRGAGRGVAGPWAVGGDGARPQNLAGWGGPGKSQDTAGQAGAHC